MTAGFSSSVLRAFTILLVCVAGRIADAQSGGLKVRVTATNRIPLSGALVALVDNSNAVFSEGLTNESGIRVLTAPAGEYRVRVRRIGYRPFFSNAVTLPMSGEFAVTVDDRRVVLSAMVITASNKCGKFDGNSEALATVWEEISKALRSSQLTSDDLANLARARIYRKQIDNYGLVTQSDSSYVSISTKSPFSAIDPEALARDGYVRGNQNRGWEYFGVDEKVLLSESFMATHCFRLTKDKGRPGQVGMSFEPAPGRTKPDVKGVLWLDEKASELRDIEFTFTNAGLLTRFNANGLTKFERLPSGAWIVKEWKLRAPILVILQGAREKIVVNGYVEDGGGVVVASVPRGLAMQKGVLRGVVFDSVMMRPVAGATVTTSGTTATSDTLGRFAFTGIPVVDQTVTFSHPSFSSFGFLGLEREVTFSSDTMDVVLSTPSMKTVWVRLCGDTLVKIRGDWNETGLMHGVVRDTAGEPVAGAIVKMFWYESNKIGAARTDKDALKQETTTDGLGRYAACGFLRTSRGNAYAVLGASQSARREFDFSKERVIRRDMSFASAASLFGAEHEITVTVVNADGGALSDATVFLEASSQTARTDDSGVAVLRTREDKPIIGVRRLGFSEQSLRVTLGNSGKHQLRITLFPVQTLATVPVRANALLPRDLQRRRAQGGIGAFYGREELDEVIALRNVIVRSPLARIDTSRGGGWAVAFRTAKGGYCAADLYIDGVLSNDPDALATFGQLDSFSPDDIAAVEVYPHIGQAPQNIVRLRDGCGAVLVWTRLWANSQAKR